MSISVRVIPWFHACPCRQVYGGRDFGAILRIVTSSIRRLVSIAAVIAVSGSPAVLSACMAVCLQAGPVATMPMEHAPASAHAHHGAVASVAVAGDRLPLPQSSSARLVATGADCCPDDRADAIARGVIQRADAQKVAPPASASPFASHLLTPVASGASPPGPPIQRPSLIRVPLVLRI